MYLLSRHQLRHQKLHPLQNRPLQPLVFHLFLLKLHYQLQHYQLHPLCQQIQFHTLYYNKNLLYQWHDHIQILHPQKLLQCRLHLHIRYLLETQLLQLDFQLRAPYQPMNLNKLQDLYSLQR